MADYETPTIIKAARAADTFKAALLYRSVGLSPIPCQGKQAAVDWKLYQRHAASSYQIMKWHDDRLFGNVAIIGGAVSGNLVFVDLDGPRAVEAFERNFPELLDTFTVQSGSGQGAHLYFTCKQLPPTTRVVGCSYGNVELRSTGTYVVAPPSIHPVSGKPYLLTRAIRPMVVDHLNDVIDWIKVLMRQKHGGNMPPPTGTAPSATLVRPEAWASAALQGECDKVMRAGEGGANNQLNVSAFKLGQIVALGKLEKANVELALFGAALACGYVARDGEAQTRRTITSGLNAGMRLDKSRPSRSSS